MGPLLRGTTDIVVEIAPSHSDAIGSLVVATKLHIPRPSPARVSRPALVQLCRSTSARLILLSATAGSGKTTLLSSWHADPAELRRFAWLSLDDRDNDPVRFWTGVLAALRTVVPEFGTGIEGALRAPRADIAELAMPMLVNALADLRAPAVLVLDDYHEIANTDVHHSMEFVIDRLPQTIQIAIASRSDPPLPLARLRARAQLLELRSNDLRLTAEEADAMLNGSLELGLSEQEVRSLQQHTEGWAAGLQLVGLSLRGREDRHGYIAAFAGDERQIVDYLAGEVLDRQSDDVRRFLLRTSILERLCGALCDAVIDAQDSAGTLATLERANLFVIPLDGRRLWYRYHHLFRDLLQHELSLTDSSVVPQLHARACAWHAAEGLIPEAIRHATAAGDYPQAAELIAANWLTYVNRGQLGTVEAWTDALPGPVASADSRLCLARAWMLLVLGRPDEVEAAVRAAENGVAPGPMRDGSHSIASSAAMVRTSARLLLGNVAAASETARVAAELEPDPDAPWRPIVTNALGMTAYWSGRFDEAGEAFRETVASGKLVGNHTAVIYALGYLATIAAEREKYAEASLLVDEALSLGLQHELAEHWVSVMVHYAAGRCARSRGQLDEARVALERGLELARRGGLRLDTIYGLLCLEQVAMAADAPDDARELHARAERQLAACADPGILGARLGRAGRSGTSRLTAQGTTAVDDLSERELAVLRLMPTQLSMREIGGQLYVSFNTVKSHARSIYCKLRVASRAEAVARARELRLL